MKRALFPTVITVILSCIAASAVAQITLNEFTPGTPILSSEVNENFEALRTGIETAVTELQAKRFSFTIQAADWDSGSHFGDGNVHRRYEIPPGVVGGVDLSSFWASGGAIVAYVRPSVAGYSELKAMPHMWSSSTGTGNIGIKVEHMPTRNAIVISRTTVGWDNLSLAEADIPDSVEVTLVLIPTGGGS